MLSLNNSEKAKIFTLQGGALIFAALSCGIFFAYLVKTGAIHSYYEKKNPPIFNTDPLILPDKYKIGFVTDAHSRSNKENQVRPNSKIPMEKFVAQMNDEFLPDFVVSGGDFIDGTKRFGEKSNNDFSLFSQIFQQINAPKYHVLGNHELRGFTREDWILKTKNENSYYFFDYGERLRIIVFDSTLITSSYDEESPKKIAYEKELVWLEETLRNSQGKRILLFSHHPLVPALRKAMPIEFITRLNELLSSYHVRAVFSGHVEVLYYEKIGGVDYFVAPGFYRSENIGYPMIGSFSELSIGLKNHLRLYYKKNEEEQEYSQVLVPSAQYYAIEKEEKEKINFLAPSSKEAVAEKEEIEPPTANDEDEGSDEENDDE